MDQKISEKSNQSSIFLTIEDYNEMYDLAKMNEEKIEDEANKLSISKGGIVTIHVEFDRYPTLGSKSLNSYYCLTTSHRIYSDDIKDKISGELGDQIAKFAKESLIDISKEYKSMEVSKKHCIGYEKRIKNLEYKISSLQTRLIFAVLSLIMLFLVSISPFLHQILK